MPPMTPRSILAAGSALVLAACADGSGPEVRSDPINADIAAAVADGAAEDVQTMRGLGVGLRMGFLLLPLAHALPPRDCPYDEISGWHECPDRTLPNGVVVSGSYAFFDASNTPMEAYDPVQTAAISLLRGVEGTITREVEGGSFTGSISHHRDLTVSGLEGMEQKRTWDGEGTSAITRTLVVDDRGSRSYELDAAVAIDGVEVPTFNNEMLDPWPLAGTITTIVTGTVTVNGESRSVTRTVVITFNGTRYPDVTVNGESFTLDLAERRIRRRQP
jgi:hypothetical protein